MTANAILITGKTYPLRRELRRAGCLFDRGEMGYLVALDKSAQAVEIANTNSLTIKPYEASEEQLTPATGDRLRAIREDRQSRRRERLLERAEAAERRARKHRDRISPSEREFLSLCEPVKIGHHSERRHRKLLDRARNVICSEAEEMAKARNLRSRANWLQPARVKGDTEARRQAVREKKTAEIGVGDTVKDAMFGVGVVTKVNKKTFSINYESRGFIQTVDKSWVSLVAKGDGTASAKPKFKAGDRVIATRLLAKYEGVVKRRTSRGYSVEYTCYGKTYTETFSECNLSSASPAPARPGPPASSPRASSNSPARRG